MKFVLTTCVQCYRFDIVVQVSVESGQSVEWMKEENYMFRLSEFGPQLLKWLDTKGRKVKLKE